MFGICDYQKGSSWDKLRSFHTVVVPNFLVGRGGGLVSWNTREVTPRVLALTYPSGERGFP